MRRTGLDCLLALLRWACLAGLGLAAAVPPALAQQRDPTLAPGAALAPAARSATRPDPTQSTLPPLEGAAVLVREGKPYLVLGPQAYGLGQKMGAYTLERISETEVWLRRGKVLSKIPIFSGIERHTATERPTP
jgi:hypothetical protein